jgi:hypothetical protein
MQPFEFILVLSSIIVGLGIANLLGMLGRILRGELRAGLLHGIWSVAVLLQLIQLFWASWTHSGHANWSIGDLSLFLLPALLVYTASSVLSPISTGEFDLDEFFVNRRRQFFAILIFMNLSNSLEHWILGDGAFGGSGDTLRGIGIMIFIALMIVRDKRVQITGAITALAILGYFTVSLTGSLGGMVEP